MNNFFYFRHSLASKQLVLLDIIQNSINNRYPTMKLQQAEFTSSTPEGTKRKSAQLKNNSIIHIGQNIYLLIFQLDFPLKKIAIF